MNCSVKVLFYNAQYIVHIIVIIRFFSVVTIVQMYKNVYIYHKMSMDYQSYAPWFEKVSQTYFDKPILNKCFTFSNLFTSNIIVITPQTMKKVLECSIFIDFYFLIQLYNEVIYYITTHQCIQFLQKM